MNIFRKTAIATGIAVISYASIAQNLSAIANPAGTASALTLNYSINPTTDFVGNNSKLYLAVLLGNTVYFYSDTAGFLPYVGGLAALTANSPAEAPPVRTITKGNETISLAGDASSVIGADVYVGYGASFANLIANSRYTRTYTIPSVVCTSPQIAQNGVCVTPPTSTATIATGSMPWFHNYLKNADGSETLILTTVGEYNKFTPPTPIVMLKSTNNGVADVTSQLFDSAPSLYWGRNVVAYKDPVTSQPAIWFCSQGREVGDYTAASTPRVNGVWGEQDKLFVMGANGKFSDQSFQLPQVVDFTHGCAAGNNGDGNSVVLVKNTLGSFGGYKGNQVLAKNASGTYGLTLFNPNILDFNLKSWWVGVGDFSKRGAVDMVYSQQVVRYENGSYRVTQVMRAPDLEAQGYTNYHSGVVGDVNGDGFADVVQILSGNGGLQPFLGGAMLALFINDGTGNLVYTPSAISSPQTPTDMGLDVRVFDVNFDGKPDIVTSGNRYGYGATIAAGDNISTRFLYINNGNGTFTKKTLADAELNSRCLAIANMFIQGCQRTYYFMANSDSSSYSIVMTGSNNAGAYIAYGRTVTPATPLGLQ